MNELLRKCLLGDESAWDAFVERYAPVISSAVRRVLLGRGLAGQEQAAEDVAQDVFVRLIRNDLHLLRSYDPSRASLVTWLTIVARSTTIDFLRRKRLAVVPLDEARAASQDASPGRLDLPEGLLTPRQELLLHLLFDRQMDVRSAAKLLGISPQTVRSTKHKAIQRLREYFTAED